MELSQEGGGRDAAESVARQTRPTSTRFSDRVTHRLSDILRPRIFAIACGYEDTDDLDRLRTDPAFKLASGRLSDGGNDPQPTVSRWENAPASRDLVRLMWVMGMCAIGVTVARIR